MQCRINRTCTAFIRFICYCRRSTKTIESYRLECAKYANASQVMSTESFGENVKNIATKFLQKVKQFFQKVALWCKKYIWKNYYQSN